MNCPACQMTMRTKDDLDRHINIAHRAAMGINIVDELKQEIRRVRRERDILHLFAVDVVQEKDSITREQAEIKVSREIFTQLQGVR